MKVLVVGSGGREHALVWKISQSQQVEKIYAAPGNPGISNLAEIVDIGVTEIEELVNFAKNHQIDLVVVGPEVPLSLGIGDRLLEEGVFCFGPTKAGAILEGSKDYAKKFMKKYSIPTASFETFTHFEDAEKYITTLSHSRPIVLKADGLAQGKGVVIAENSLEATDALKEMMTEQCFGEAGSKVVIEEFLTGEEVSLLTFCDGKNMIPMLPVQDHKRIGDGDTGLNTGGMGTYAPTSIYTDHLAKQVREEIILPILQGLKEEKIDYRGCLYIGIMLTTSGPKVIEFNARFGDPETEVLMPLLGSDLAEILLGCAKGNLDVNIEWEKQSTVCVILASAGYPQEYQTGYSISGLEKNSENTVVFQAGTSLNSKNEIATAGGRVLAVVGMGKNIQDAQEKAYHRQENIHFTGKYFRSDIGYRELKRFDSLK